MNKQKWMNRALESGLEGLEISQSEVTSREMSWFENKMDSFVTSKVVKTGIRAVCENKIVSVSLEKVDDHDMDSIFENLKDQAAAVSETEKDALVPMITWNETLSLHQWVRPSMDQVEDVLSSLEKKFLAVENVKMVNELSWSDARSKSSIVNTLGLKVFDKVEYQLLSAQITMEKDGLMRDGYDIAIVGSLKDFDQDAFVKKLCDKVRFELGASSMKSTTTPVIFDGEAMSTLFSCYVPAFYGSLIAKGISPLTDKIGQKIFSDQVTVIDNPRNQDALVLQNYDDEGHPTYQKIVVNHGIFETVLHNTKSAIKMNAESTGNGFAAGGGGTDVSAKNIYIVPGRDSLDELILKMNNGVIITELNGMHAGVDFVSGNFSLQARGILVENGKKVRPLTLITVAGNFFELMNQVVAIGNDLDWKYREAVSPSILFEKAAITGNEE